jgi:Circularly permutated YpsA SLOG family
VTLGVSVRRIVSGGQTGADRAALDWAIGHGIDHGGWCPRGRRAEDGTIPSRYRLTETPNDRYAERTEWNVRDSDGTVILSVLETLTGGSKRTAELARRHDKPCLHLSRLSGRADAGECLRGFVRAHGILVLNVAGPRASSEPEIGAFVTKTLDRAFLVASPG